MDSIEEVLCQDAGSEIVLLSSLVAMTLGHNLSAYEQNLFGNLLQSIGQNLCILSIRKAKCKSELNTELESSETEINENITNDEIR